MADDVQTPDSDALSEEQMKEYAEKLKLLAQQFGPGVMDKLGSGIKEKQGFNFVFLICFLVVTSVLVFFGYKIYKSYVDREKKREEKRLLKQQKKKKH